MIKPNELRIGNYLQDNKGAIAKVDAGVICMLDDLKIEVLYGIPITYSILNRCGFRQFGKWENHFTNGKLDIDTKNGNILYQGRMDDPETKEFSPTVDYLHQLQNLYFALTDEELIVAGL